MPLQYLTHSQIDFDKWDKALAACANKLIYAESVYLNTMATTWDAIVNEDWTCIMPIPVKKKYGIKYVPQLPFIQQLGIFSKTIIGDDVQHAFFTLMKKKIRKIDYNLNYACIINGQTQFNNYILNLNKPYTNIKEGYKNDLKKDLQKYSELEILKTNNYTKAIQLFFETYAERLSLLNDENFSKFNTLIETLGQQGKAFCYEATYMDELIAVALFLKDENRMYNIASTILPKGKKLSANHFLYNKIIMDFAAQQIILDFEGSDIPGIATFYKQFGCVNQPYNKIVQKLFGRF